MPFQTFTQQSAVGEARGLLDLQLSLPHLSPALQSLSVSQSPSPTSHCLVDVQQLHLVAPVLQVPEEAFTQQSAVEEARLLLDLQLSLPHLSPALQSMSVSQSPSPMLHRLVDVQQLQLVAPVLQFPEGALTQQSAVGEANGLLDLQLSLPHLSPALQSLSASQSPSPTSHCLVDVQQLHLVAPVLQPKK